MTDDLKVRFLWEDIEPSQEQMEAIASALLAQTDAEALEKAVAPHDSHIAQRDKSGRFVEFKWRRESPRGTAGKFVRRLTREEQAEATRLSEGVRARFAVQMRNHLGDLQKGRLTAEESSERGREAIASHYEQIFRNGMQAAGNPAIILTPRDKAALSRIVRDEGDFWQNFMSDVANGKGTIPYPDRLEMYVGASHEPYWLGWLLGDFRPKRLIRWLYGKTESHCKDCSAMVKRGVMTVVEFYNIALKNGLLPHSGYLSCRGIRCDCRLEDVT